MIQLNQRVTADGREGITVRKGCKDKTNFWCTSMDDTGMLECFSDAILVQLESDRTKAKRVPKPPPQVERLFHTEEYSNDVAMSDKSRDDFRV